MKTVAIIPARGGSKSIPKKSIQPLMGYPLLAYSIAVGKLSKRIDRVIISTDSEEIASIGRSFGAEVPFLRPPELARDNSPDLEFVLHALEWFRDTEGEIPDLLVHLRPTTPLREASIVDQAIDNLILHSGATSLRSAHPASESPFKWFVLGTDGFFKGLQEGLTNDQINKPRQEFPPVFIPDGYVDVLKSDFVLKNKTMYGKNMLGFVSPVCTEVDSQEDFQFLEFQITQSSSPLLNFLKSNFQ